MYLSNINIRHQLFVWIRVLIVACRHVATCIRSAFSASNRTFQTMLSTVTAFWIAVCLTSAIYISELSFNFFGGDFWWILKFSIFVHLCMYVCLWCLAPLSTIFQLYSRCRGLWFFSKKIFWFPMLLEKIFWFWWRNKK
jgi:hypothetical protein